MKPECGSRARYRLLATGTVAILLLLTRVASGQYDPSFTTVVDGIRRGDPASINRAGDSGDIAFVPYLKAITKHISVEGASINETVALVKLEDRDTQQAAFCMVVAESTEAPVAFFQFVGGWYSIRALDALLDGVGEQAFRRAAARSIDRDISFLPPRILALDTLPKVAPNPPIAVGLDGMPAIDRNDAVGRWHQWIAEHRDDLSHLRPVGDGVQYTDEACAKRQSPSKER